MRIIFAILILAYVAQAQVDLKERAKPYEHLLPVDRNLNNFEYEKLIEKELFGLYSESEGFFQVSDLCGKVFVSSPDRGELGIIVYKALDKKGRERFIMYVAEAQYSIWDFYLNAKNQQEDSRKEFPEVDKNAFFIEDDMAFEFQNKIWDALRTVRYPNYLAPSTKGLDCSYYRIESFIVGLGVVEGQVTCPESKYELSLVGYFERFLKDGMNGEMIQETD